LRLINFPIALVNVETSGNAAYASFLVVSTFLGFNQSIPTTEVLMKKLINLAAGLITGATLMMSATAAMARDVDVRIVERPAYNQGRPYHAAPRYHDRYSRYDRHHRRPMAAGARRDRDGDGVPNRFDARPNNPRRY
jgi:hypothetical protein